MTETPSTRTEKDPLGPLDVPADAYYGVQTQRAIRNFPISGRRPDIALVRGAVQVKKAAARANQQTGRLSDELAGAIVRAADEILGLAPDLDHSTAGNSDRQLPSRSVPGRRRRQPQHEHQRGARQSGDRDPRRSEGLGAARGATTRSSIPTTTSTWPSRRTTRSRLRCASRRWTAWPSCCRCSTSSPRRSPSAGAPSTASSRAVARTCRTRCPSGSARSSPPMR